MIMIPAVRAMSPDGDLLSPAHPFPFDAIAIACNGEVYTVYQTGDVLPTQG